ncbi:MAG: DegT/DnrJ/EryC1/StrS family aminotransferase [Caulobacterales bacterium]
MAALKRSILPTPAAPVPVARPRLPTREALTPYLDRIDEARRYANAGPLVRELEGRLAARLSESGSVATVANHTQALTLALKAAGAKAGTLCAMPAWTFVASAHAAVAAGLTPYFIDVDPATWMLDPARMADVVAAAPGEVGAIMPVAVFGLTPHLPLWWAVGEATGLPVVVDGADAFDALDCAPVPVAISLHAQASVAAGEGGYVACEDEALVERVRDFTTLGLPGDPVAAAPATNGMISEYAAAVALASLDAWPADRARFGFAAQYLKVALALTPQIEFQPGWGTSWFSSVCVVGTPKGAAPAIAKAMNRAGVEARGWWGGGCHTHPAFAACPREPLPVTDALAVSTLGLPYFIDLDEADSWRIVDALLEALKVSDG